MRTNTVSKKKLFCLQNESENKTSCNVLLSKNQFIQEPQLTLKPTTKQVVPQATHATILFVKGVQRPSTHSKTFWRWGRKLGLSLRNQLPNKQGIYQILSPQSRTKHQGWFSSCLKTSGESKTGPSVQWFSWEIPTSKACEVCSTFSAGLIADIQASQWPLSP